MWDVLDYPDYSTQITILRNNHLLVLYCITEKISDLYMKEENSEFLKKFKLRTFLCFIFHILSILPQSYK